jgi:hypothetical protein
MITRHKRRSRRDRKANEALGLPADFRVPFGACYVYSPEGGSETAERSRLLCSRVKSGTSWWLQSYATRVHEQSLPQQCLSELFNPSAVLVPVPKCHSVPGASTWVARKLALALKTTGLGGSVWTGLQRVREVKRSSAAWRWERPTVQQHFSSFAVMPPVTAPAPEPTAPEPTAPEPTEIVLIDDVVTKGRTLVAAAIRLQLTFPQTPIRAFALIRTLGLVPDVERVFDPCRGEIRWNGMDAHRDP